MSVQMRLFETHCNTCKHYSIGDFDVKIISYVKSECRTVTVPDCSACNLHNTRVLLHSRACKDYEGALN